MKESNQNGNTAFLNADEAVKWIVGLVPFGIKPGLKRMERLMEMLDHPERRLKFIHVAGTNGKGSTCAFLGETLQRSGYGVGMFTSPYLESFRNRLKYNGEDIPEEDLTRLANRLKPLTDEIGVTELGPLSMFEVTTALAILYFATVAYPDYVVWETGLGGRLDCTNIVTPVVSVITNVGHDHMDILGNTIEEIAAEKAGIIKPGVPVITAAEQPEVRELIQRVSGEKQASLYMMNDNFSFKPTSVKLNDQQFDFKGPFRDIAGLPVSLNGMHQLKNAAVAVMTLEVLRQYYALIVEDETLAEALKATLWPGRLEMVSERPRILLDGAHNPEGAEVLAQALRKIYRSRELIFMVGMLTTKDHAGYLRHLLPLADTVIFTEPDFAKKMDAARLAELAESLLPELGNEPEILVEPDWKKALERLMALTGDEDLGVVTGTLYMISDVRSWIRNQSHSEKGW